jgi:hypothetical protein
MTKPSSVPRPLEGLIPVAGDSLEAAKAIGAAVGLLQNTAEKIEENVFDLLGDPDNIEATPGKHRLLANARNLEDVAQAARRAAVEQGIKFVAQAIDYLKGILGRSYNDRWQIAGFTRGTISVAHLTNPQLHLIQIGDYFRDHSGHEVPALFLTAAHAHALSEAILAARTAEASATEARRDAKIARDASAKALYDRLVGLRGELGQLLEDDDNRWNRFGFARPIDGRLPEPVTGLTLTLGVPGEIRVAFDPAVRAVNYRVSRQILGVDVEPVEVGLFTDRLVLIGGLPAGKTVEVSVTARNKTGETGAAKAQIALS